MTDGRSRKSRLCDLMLVVHHETDRAWLVSETGDQDKSIWLPKSQAEKDPTERGQFKFWPIHEFTMPEWLAIEKGLV